MGATGWRLRKGNKGLYGFCLVCQDLFFGRCCLEYQVGSREPSPGGVLRTSLGGQRGKVGGQGVDCDGEEGRGWVGGRNWASPLAAGRLKLEVWLRRGSTRTGVVGGRERPRPK